jgi:hypothetical protein
MARHHLPTSAVVASANPPRRQLGDGKKQRIGTPRRHQWALAVDPPRSRQACKSLPSTLTTADKAERVPRHPTVPVHPLAATPNPSSTNASLPSCPHRHSLHNIKRATPIVQRQQPSSRSPPPSLPTSPPVARPSRLGLVNRSDTSRRKPRLRRDRTRNSTRRIRCRDRRFILDRTSCSRLSARESLARSS